VLVQFRSSFSHFLFLRHRIMCCSSFFFFARELRSGDRKCMSTTFWRAAKGLLGLELAAVAGAYGLFHGLVCRCFRHRALYSHILHAKRKHTTTNFCVYQVDAADTPFIPFQVCFICVCVCDYMLVRACVRVLAFMFFAQPQHLAFVPRAVLRVCTLYCQRLLSNRRWRQPRSRRPGQVRGLLIIQPYDLLPGL